MAGCEKTNKTPKKVTYIDLSHRIKNGTVTYPGMPPVEISTLFSRETVAEWNGNGPDAGALLDQIKMANINGTYIDGPLHAIEGGASIADYSIEKLVNLPTVVVKMKDCRNYFDTDDFQGVDVKGCAVLLFSGWDKKFGTEEYGPHAPYLTVAGAKYLIGNGVVFVGIDSPLIDNFDTQNTVGIPVHGILLKNDIPICEDMTGLEKMPATGALLTAIPPAVEMASFPARVFATITEK